MSIQTLYSRIIVLREILELSQNKFSENVGITQSALSQLESGKSKLSLDSLVKISTKYKINCNWLVNGKGKIFIEEEEKEPAKSFTSIVTVDSESKALIPFVKEEAHAGYIKSLGDTEYLQTLDVYKIPGYEKGSYRLFEITGDSMVPSLNPREIVVSELCEDWDNLENGTMGIIITEDAIVAKRIYFYEEDRSTIILKSDNPQFKTYGISLKETKEIWEVKAKITNIFAGETMINSKKIETLESDIQAMKKQIEKINKPKSAKNFNNGS